MNSEQMATTNVISAIALMAPTREREGSSASPATLGSPCCSSSSPPSHSPENRCACEESWK